MKKLQEVEVKISVADAEGARACLKENGFRIRTRRVFERNLVLDDERGSLREGNLLLRVRTAGTRITCTFKGKEIAGRHKRRMEREFHPDDQNECLAVFGGLGYTPKYIYEKYRTEFSRPNEPGTAVTLDETPIGIFLELEGPARWIDRTAKKLGFSRADYITASYGALHSAWRAEYGLECCDMTF